MLERTDFNKKQLVFLFTLQGEKLAFKNDNLVVLDSEGKIKYQTTCYQIFMIFVVGDLSITTGLIRRARKFQFTICLLSASFKVYSVIGNRMEGNTLLHRKQYEYDGNEIAQFIVSNKIRNQRETLNRIRKKSKFCKEAIATLDGYLKQLDENQLTMESLLGVEGSASRVYFPEVFSNVLCTGRKPRVKADYMNTILDIGYTLLFNFIDSLLQVFGFDVYCGVYHREFYMRKSLVCDIMEPMRPMIDWKIRTAINLEQFKKEDFQIVQNQYCLSFKSGTKYVSVLLEEILHHKNEIFIYVRDYYRNFMKGRNISQYNYFEMEVAE